MQVMCMSHMLPSMLINPSKFGVQLHAPFSSRSSQTRNKCNVLVQANNNTSNNSNDQAETSSLPPLPVPPNLQGKSPRKFWNAVSLAFLGDSVWELYARRKYFHPPTRVTTYYAAVVSQVRAEAQSKLHDALKDGTFLTEEEKTILRWGRNATGTLPKRHKQSELTKEVYRNATAIECLVGYLYLTDGERLHSVMQHLGMDTV